MKLFENTYDFEYPWEQVTAANWQKYPNKVSTHVIGVDVLRRELQDNGNVLVSERLLTVQQKVPRWIMMVLGGSNISYVREVSTVNLREKSLKLRSCNLNYVNLLRVYEMVDYTPHPEDPYNKTLFSQQAQITAGRKFGKLVNTLEDWSIQRFCDNAAKGKAGFDSVLRSLWEEHWDNNSLVMKMNETVDDLGLQMTKRVNEMNAAAEIVIKESLRKFTILTDYQDLFTEAFEDVKKTN